MAPMAAVLILQQPLAVHVLAAVPVAVVGRKRIIAHNSKANRDKLAQRPEIN